MAFADALRALNSMKGDGVVQDYAVAGAMAMVFWSEPVPTYDLDVLVLLPTDRSPIVSLAPIYDWAKGHGYPERDEHVVIEGLPTQFIPSPSILADEAIATAPSLEYEGVPVRVVAPEYLVALYLLPEARTAKRRERAAMLMESPGLNRTKLDEILNRHDIKP